MNRKQEDRIWKFYYDKVLPETTKIVTRKANKSRLLRNYGLLVATVGLSPEPILISINVLKPKKVLFITTERETKGILDEIIEHTYLKTNGGYSTVYFADKADFYQKLILKINRMLNKEANKRVVFNITGGTKHMSASCFAISMLGLSGFDADAVYVKSDYKNAVVFGNRRIPAPESQEIIKMLDISKVINPPNKTKPK